MCSAWWAFIGVCTLNHANVGLLPGLAFLALGTFSCIGNINIVFSLANLLFIYN